MISVIIPILDGAVTLPVQLGALAGQTYDGDWEVIVADGGSRNETVDVVRAWTSRLPRFRVVHVAGAVDPQVWSLRRSMRS